MNSENLNKSDISENSSSNKAICMRTRHQTCVGHAVVLDPVFSPGD